MTTPTMVSFSQIAPIIIQEYERYLPTAFDDSMTMLEKVNKVIQQLNSIGQLTNDVVTQWNTVMEWVMNDGMNESINTRLDEMVTDGTFDSIINENVFNLLDGRISSLETTNKTKSLNQENISPSHLFAFFRSNTDTRFDLFFSSDGVSMERAKLVNVNLRDPSLFYHNGVFYVAYTSYNPHDFGILKSKNLVDWEDVKISVGLFNAISTQRIWAPEWFKDDNGKIYLVMSVWVGETTDIDGITIPNFRPYIVEVTDIENDVYGVPRALNLESSNKIDGHLTKKNNEYILLIKDEYDKKTEVWVSSDMLAWVKRSDYISELGSYVEGVFIVPVDGGYNVYVDEYKTGQTYYTFTTDFSNFSERKPIDIKDPHRHGSGIQITDEKAKKIFSDFYTAYGKTKQKHNKNITNLFNFSVNSVVADFNPIEGNIYAINNNENLIINNITNKYNAKYFYFVLRTNSVGSLKVLNSGDVEVPSDGFVMDVAYGDNDLLVKFELVEYLNKFKPATPTLKRFYDRKVSPIDKRLGWKTVTLTTQTLDPLTVEDGVIYRVNAGNDVVINSISSLASASKIGFLLASSTTGSLTIKSGTNITVAGGQIALTPTSDNESVIEFVKVDGSTFRRLK